MGLKIGSVIRTKTVIQNFEGIRLTQKIKPKFSAVCLLLDIVEEKEAFKAKEAEEVLMSIGWFKGNDLIEFFTKEQAEEFKKFLKTKYPNGDVVQNEQK